MKFVLERVENIVEKGENVGYQHFLLYLQCFEKAFLSQGCENPGLLGKGLELLAFTKIETIYRRQNKCNSKTEL